MKQIVITADSVLIGDRVYQAGDSPTVEDGVAVRLIAAGKAGVPLPMAFAGRAPEPAAQETAERPRRGRPKVSTADLRERLASAERAELMTA